MDALVVEPRVRLVRGKDVVDDNNGSGVGKCATRNDADCPAPTRHEYAASGCEHVDLRKRSVP
ncbi:unannotated protein [freshwater metagenome]|uniref:Unannotated protein n=1 Tax=freshwater metagenome TaxID=449393 RepID=A0A6J6TMQ7_9ZZZZ